MHAFGALWHTLVRVWRVTRLLVSYRPLAQFFHQRAGLGRGCRHQAECSEVRKNCFSSEPERLAEKPSQPGSLQQS